MRRFLAPRSVGAIREFFGPNAPVWRRGNLLLCLMWSGLAVMNLIRVIRGADSCYWIFLAVACVYFAWSSFRGWRDSNSRRQRAIVPIAVVLLLCTACATGSTDALKGQVAQVKADVADLRTKREEAVADLRAFTAADARAALATATRGNDLAAMTCYPKVLQVLERHGAAQAGAPGGLLDAFERLRLIVHPAGGKDDSLDVACAALRTQIEKDILKFEALVAGLVASGGIAGISSVPDALAAAPKVLQLLRSLGAGGP